MIRVRLFFRWFLSPVLAILLLACVGCWEEVRYDPSNHDSSKGSTISQSELHEVATPVGEQLPDESPTAEQIEPEQLTVKEAATQPDEPLANALDSQKDIPSATDSPAPPSEFGWFDDPPSPKTAEQPESITSPHTLAAAWQIGSKWSLAAAYFAKGLGTSRTSEPLEQAGTAAELLEIDLPPLPENPEKASLQPMVVRYLLEESGPQLLDRLGESFPADHRALAELAIKTHALLLVYTPGNKDLEPLVLEIGLAAEHSGLPESVWRKLVDLLQQRADYASIKRAVFDLHDQATDFLADSAGE